MFLWLRQTESIMFQSIYTEWDFYMIQPNFCLTWPRGFREEDFEKDYEDRCQMMAKAHDEINLKKMRMS